MPKRTWLPPVARAAVVLALGAGALLAPPVTPQSISTDGMVESKSGGFEFPDGTIQTTAAGSGDPCPTVDPSDEMIEVGGVCIDKYEASIWDALEGGEQITGEIPCSAHGQDCFGVIFARSVEGVLPRADITWFQAQQALANSGKRLPTNAEWHMAVRGTPSDTGTDTTPCNTRTEGPAATGSSPGCVSRWGAFDMVGNVWEWVADWVPLPITCGNWGNIYDGPNEDVGCIVDVSDTAEGPGALIRGGYWTSEEGAGPLAVSGLWFPSMSDGSIGFRGAR